MENCRNISIQALPLELRHHILASVGDVASVVNAAATCRSLNEAFRTASQHILRTSMIEAVGLNVLPHAILSYRCKERRRNASHEGSGGWDRDDAAKYTRQYLASIKRPDPHSIDWTIRDALGVQQLHFYVTEFTERFIQACSDAPHGNIKESLGATPASDAERCRIMQTFYRFELYRKLFKTFGSISESESLQRSFLQLYSPWENAQLACVHDFLCRIVALVFNDVAQHDIAWGRYRVCFDTDESSPYVQHLLSLGLAKIYELASTASYAERERLLCLGDTIPEIHCGFLYEALTCMTEAPEEYADSIRLDLLVGQPAFHDDGDDGPRSTWKQSHVHHNIAEVSGIATAAIYYVMDRSRRQWGYVMWDRKRIDSLCLEDPFVGRPAADFYDEQVPSQSDMVTSWRARKAIFDKGGRGWWSPEDDSQVMWTRLQK